MRKTVLFMRSSGWNEGTVFGRCSRMAMPHNQGPSGLRAAFSRSGAFHKAVVSVAVTMCVIS